MNLTAKEQLRLNVESAQQRGVEVRDQLQNHQDVLIRYRIRRKYCNQNIDNKGLNVLNIERERDVGAEMGNSGPRVIGLDCLNVIVIIMPYSIET